MNVCEKVMVALYARHPMSCITPLTYNDLYSIRTSSLCDRASRVLVVLVIS